MASNINIKISNAKGTSEKPGKEGWIEVLSWHWGMTHAANPVTDQDTHGRPTIQEFVITKLHDNSSGDLIKFLVGGDLFVGDEDVVFTMTKTKDKEEVDFLTIKFIKCVVAGVQMKGGDAEHGDRVTEDVTLRFAKFTYEYVGDGENAGSIDAEYDARKTRGKIG
jgi:type VI secretion system Hcp family effector